MTTRCAARRLLLSAGGRPSTVPITGVTMTDPTPETARALLWRHGLPEDVIDGALCLHGQELAVKARTTDLPDWADSLDTFDNGAAWTADLVDPTVPDALAGTANAEAHRQTAPPVPVSSTVPAPTELRDRVADALADADGWRWAPGFKAGSPTWQQYLERADAVLAVLPERAEAHRLALSEALGLGTGAPWDAIHDRVTELGLPPLTEDPVAQRLGLVAAYRATVLLEAADRYEEILAKADTSADPRYWTAVRDITLGLRRMAGGTAGDKTETQPDTLAAWLYQRFAVIHGAPPWDRTDDSEHGYWEHHAAAVRRAVARGGFKPAAGAGQDGTEDGRG